jgi:uncharacterized protein with FMN-binding domain
LTRKTVRQPAATTSGGARRITNRLVALGSAAVLTVYAAGYLRTRSAAQRLADAESDRRRPVVPAPAEAGPPVVMPEPPARAAAAAGQPVSTRKSARPRAEATRAATPPATPTPERTETPALPASAATTADPPVNAATAGGDARTIEPAVPTAPKPASLYKDGTYYGWGTSRHGDIQASVVIQDGRIVSAGIAQCLTRYSCSWIAHLPPQVVIRQSAEVDYVSGATQSTNAFYYGILEALSRAK